ncbi:GWxTD domain-containing protein [bacterium]|nr:GWxTD domain-containing protein [bacterium]
MRKVIAIILLLATVFFNGCGYIKSEIQANKNKKNISQDEKKNLYLLTIFGKHSEVKSYLLKETLKERQYFSKSFWMMYDNDISSSRNSFFVKILKRYSYAKLKYKHMITSGENTDMGRTYIKYGRPTEININPMDIQREDYQQVVQWQYNSPILFKITFKDENGTGDFRILADKSDIIPVTGDYFRYRTLKEIFEWRTAHEK